MKWILKHFLGCLPDWFIFFLFLLLPLSLLLLLLLCTRKHGKNERKEKKENFVFVCVCISPCSPIIFMGDDLDFFLSFYPLSLLSTCRYIFYIYSLLAFGNIPKSLYKLYITIIMTMADEIKWYHHSHHHLHHQFHHHHHHHHHQTLHTSMAKSKL